MNPMVGSYIYIFTALIVLVFLGVKLYLRSKFRFESNRPALPISNDDIVAAIRTGRMSEAVQLYGLLHRIDMAQAAVAVHAMAAQIRSAQAGGGDAIQPGETPEDHRET